MEFLIILLLILLFTYLTFLIFTARLACKGVIRYIEKRWGKSEVPDKKQIRECLDEITKRKRTK